MPTKVLPVFPVKCTEREGERERRDIVRQLDIIVTESGNNGENVTRGEWRVYQVLITYCQTKGNVVRMRERLRQQESLTPSEKVL